MRGGELGTFPKIQPFWSGYALVTKKYKMFEMPWQYELTGRQLESLCANTGTLPSVPTAQCLPRVPTIPS